MWALRPWARLPSQPVFPPMDELARIASSHDLRPIGPPMSVEDCDTVLAGPVELVRSEGAIVHVQALGHVVLKVRDLHRSEGFYSGMLGMRIISRNSNPRMTFFSLGTPGIHHDFALLELGSAAPEPEHEATGLAHVAFKVGESSRRSVSCGRRSMPRERLSSSRRSDPLRKACTSSIRTGTRSSCTSTPNQMWHCPGVRGRPLGDVLLAVRRPSVPVESNSAVTPS